MYLHKCIFKLAQLRASNCTIKPWWLYPDFRSISNKLSMHMNSWLYQAKILSEKHFFIIFNFSRITIWIVKDIILLSFPKFWLI
ncbi:unnamed protein product [Blepharisma stoltei]|uniref:Uncharacterized protein n=1 Tax=Blepharisma stoltei TaxID=1481888 RepID=A0AAU9JW07_9CILI|nr:unnamed protein product [Blepharisma stoltei]